jgi:adenosylcobyric acid synthase
MAKTLMFMGTGSDVGKSLIVAGLCRAYTSRGLRVAPFKPQNMSNNAAVTADGGEIGRAQALQARAARREPLTAMNPVLLKPEHESGAQLIVRGQRVGSFPARDYWARRGELLPDVVAAFRELAADADLVLIEGAGSASEINLRAGDLANFGFAQAVQAPVVVIGDIDRGGVIAALVGTFAVLEPADRALIRATLVNRFRGDPALFHHGLVAIAARTAVPCLGPVPYLPEAARLPAEDSLALDAKPPEISGSYIVAVPRLPRIANFDDLDPLRAEPNVSVIVVESGNPLPQNADLILIPGSKATRADLAALRQEGWDIDILAHYRAGKSVLGICGGYQMLGRSIDDPVESGRTGVPGLGLLPVDTRFDADKVTRLRTGTAMGRPVHGYQIHHGRVQVAGGEPFVVLEDGSVDGVRDGRCAGTTLHGLFEDDELRRSFLAMVAAERGKRFVSAGRSFAAARSSAVDAVADALAEHLDLAAVERLIATAAAPIAGGRA